MFNGDPGAVGRTLMVRGQPATVVGIMPEGALTAVAADLWTPLRAGTAGEGAEANYTILLRVRPGVEWGRAEAEARQIDAEAVRVAARADGTA